MNCKIMTSQCIGDILVCECICIHKDRACIQTECMYISKKTYLQSTGHSRGKDLMKAKVALDDPSGLPGKMATISRMEKILGLELLVLGLSLPVPHPLVRSPLITTLDGLFQGMAPYPGTFQEDGQIMQPRNDGSPIDVGFWGILGLVVGQGMDVHVAIEQIPPRNTAPLGLVVVVGLRHGFRLVQDGLEDSSVVLVGVLARWPCRRLLDHKCLIGCAGFRHVEAAGERRRR
mmetsp:Transcript_18307/g.52399  ORF Transcript_18307/g.52399 Transcript_18307/m.52399 type:complete len:232 (+) Transcript_18307:731-1426(+)